MLDLSLNGFIVLILKPFFNLCFQWLSFEIFNFPVWSYLLAFLVIGSFLALFRVGNNSVK